MGPERSAGEGIPRETTRRLFVALWPDEAMRQAMAQAVHKAARASGGRPVPAANLHITLVFLGSVPERRLGELAEVVRKAATGPGFASVAESVGPQSPARQSALPAGRLQLTFDRIEHWRGAQILCALPVEPPAPIVALARRLQEQLAASGFAPDLKPFRPHVTVVRKVLRPGRIERMDPVPWSFNELALVESRMLPEGALYSVVEAFPLCVGKNGANNSETT